MPLRLKLMICLILLCPLQYSTVHADNSTNVTGALGLITVPNARMEKQGTARIGVGYSDPYTHGFIGFQFTDYLYAGLRQTTEGSGFGNSAENLLPGLDLKVRLMEETKNRPAIVLGFESAIGHTQTGSEYIALSKRYNNFDFTGGIAWGRLGSAGHIKNPLSFISHFDQDRNLGANASQNTSDWFTGEQIGFFGGVEYDTRLKDVSVKAEYGADDYTAAQLTAGFDAPDPWAIGLNYQPWNSIDLGIGVIGGEQVMARLSVQNKLQNWGGRPSPQQQSVDLRSPRPTDRKIKKGPTRLGLSAYSPISHQIGRTARLHADKMQPDQEDITIKLHHKGLKGPVVTLIRSDLEKAVLHKAKTPEEIWHDAHIAKNKDGIFSFKRERKKEKSLRLILHNQISLSQFDTAPLYRTSILTEYDRPLKYGFLVGGRARLNIADNLKRLREVQTLQTSNLRSDEEAFAMQFIAIDQFYSGWLHSINSDTHIALTGGYLEEMFSGYGGEILYRPFDKNYAIGVEAFKAQKRTPGKAFGVQENLNDDLTTAHLNLFYEPPNKDMTFYLKAGRFLAGDYGATAGLQTTFNNGAQLEGFITQTNEEDLTLLGNVSDTFGGIRLRLPIGNAPLIPHGSEIRLDAEPFSRGTGQVLDRPLQLYEVTEPLSARRIQQSWHSLLD